MTREIFQSFFEEREKIIRVVRFVVLIGGAIDWAMALQEAEMESEELKRKVKREKRKLTRLGMPENFLLSLEKFFEEVRESEEG